MESEASRILEDSMQQFESVRYNDEKDIEQKMYPKGESKLFFGNTVDFYEIFEQLARNNKDIMFVLVGENEVNQNENVILDNNLPNLHMITWEHWKARYIIGYISGATVSTQSICYIQAKDEKKYGNYGNNIAFNSFYSGILDARKTLYFSTFNVTLNKIGITMEENIKENISNLNCGIIHYNLVSSYYEKFLDEIGNYPFISYLESNQKNNDNNAIISISNDLIAQYRYFMENFDKIRAGNRQIVLLGHFDKFNRTSDEEMEQQGIYLNNGFTIEAKDNDYRQQIKESIGALNKIDDKTFYSKIGINELKDYLFGRTTIVKTPTNNDKVIFKDLTQNNTNVCKPDEIVCNGHGKLKINNCMECDCNLLYFGTNCDYNGYIFIFSFLVISLPIIYVLYKSKGKWQRKKGWLWDVDYEELVTDTPWQYTRTGMIGYSIC